MRTGKVGRVAVCGGRAGWCVVLLAAGVQVGVGTAQAQKATLLTKGRWEQVEALTPREVPGFRPAKTVRLSQYGGLATRKVKATGFFRTEKVNGRWWLVDPEGCLFISAGLCSVNLSMFGDKPGKLGTTAKWAEATAELLRDYGFNSLGRWSDWPAFRKLERPIPYCTKLSFMSGYKNVRDPQRGERGYPHESMPVFDPEFEAFCAEHAKQLAATKDDPWLLGHFSDNEIPFRPYALTCYLKLPASDPGHREAVAWLAKRGRTPKQATKADEAGFQEHVARRYYSTVAKAIKAVDPNHLYLGSRLHGRCITEATMRGARACDVVSVNYYHRWTAEADRMTRWLKASGRPFIASEWYAMSLDSAKREVGGAGFRVKTDRDRGLFYSHFTLSLLRHPSCVGWHWFKYGGDGEGFHKGIVDPRFQPHQPMLDVMKQANGQLYPLALHFLRRTR